MIACGGARGSSRPSSSSHLACVSVPPCALLETPANGCHQASPALVEPTARSVAGPRRANNGGQIPNFTVEKVHGLRSAASGPSAEMGCNATGSGPPPPPPSDRTAHDSHPSFVADEGPSPSAFETVRVIASRINPPPQEGWPLTSRRANFSTDTRRTRWNRSALWCSRLNVKPAWSRQPQLRPQRKTERR